MALIFVLHVHMVGLNSRSRLPILEQLYSADMWRKVLELVFWREACLALRERSMLSNTRVNSSSNEPVYASSDHGHRSWIGKSCFLQYSCQTVSLCGFSDWYFLVCPFSSVHRFRWNIMGTDRTWPFSYCPCGWASCGIRSMRYGYNLFYHGGQSSQAKRERKRCMITTFGICPTERSVKADLCDIEISSNNSCGSFRTSCLR